MSCENTICSLWDECNKILGEELKPLCAAKQPNKKVYPISAPQPIGCLKHEEGVSCSRDFGPKFRCGKIPCEFIFHRVPL